MAREISWNPMDQNTLIGTDVSRLDGVEKASGFACVDATCSLPFPDATFTVVLCIDAIGHSPPRPTVLAE